MPSRVVDWRWVREHEEILVFAASGAGAVVAVGSVWRSLEPDDKGRKVEVIGIFPVTRKARCLNVETGRSSTVDLGRFIGRSRHSFKPVER